MTPSPDIDSMKTIHTSIAILNFRDGTKLTNNVKDVEKQSAWWYFFQIIIYLPDVAGLLTRQAHHRRQVQKQEEQDSRLLHWHSEED